MTNLTSGGTAEQIVHLCQCGVLDPFCNLLTADDAKIICIILDGLTNIFNAAKHISDLAVDEMRTVIEANGGLDKIEQLQNHKNDEVYKKAHEIIETFFPEDVRFYTVKLLSFSYA